MPRRKVLTIDVSQLQKGTEVYTIFAKDPIFEGYDLSTLTISVKKSITPVIKDAARSAMFLERYLAANPNCCEDILDIPSVSKQNLAKMMRVSRSTLDKWLNDRLIVPIAIESWIGIEIFNPYEILSQLKNQKKE